MEASHNPAVESSEFIFLVMQWGNSGDASNAGRSVRIREAKQDHKSQVQHNCRHGDAGAQPSARSLPSESPGTSAPCFERSMYDHIHSCTYSSIYLAGLVPLPPSSVFSPRNVSTVSSVVSLCLQLRIQAKAFTFGVNSFSTRVCVCVNAFN